MEVFAELNRSSMQQVCVPQGAPGIAFGTCVAKEEDCVDSVVKEKDSAAPCPQEAPLCCMHTKARQTERANRKELQDIERLVEVPVAQFQEAILSERAIAIGIAGDPSSRVLAFTDAGKRDGFVPILGSNPWKVKAVSDVPIDAGVIDTLIADSDVHRVGETVQFLRLCKKRASLPLVRVEKIISNVAGTLVTYILPTTANVRLFS